MFLFRTVRRKAAALIALLTAVCVAAMASAGSDLSLAGSWSYRDLPDTTVIVLQEDGTALYGSGTYAWSRTEQGILLTGADGSEAELRCEVTEGGMTLWLPTIYQRTAGTEGLIGAWEALGTSKSSFAFATNGQFLEDGVFTGDYAVDEENGRITLKYIEYFADTVIDYTFADGYLVVSYPWQLARP